MESSSRTVIGSFFSRMDNQTKKKLCLLLCIIAQFAILAALVLQGRRVRELYDLKEWYDLRNKEHLGSVNDLEITICIDLFISAMVFGCLGQLFAWAGLLWISITFFDIKNLCFRMLGPGLFIFSSLPYLVFDILCMVIFRLYSGGASWLPAIIGCFSGLLGTFTTASLSIIIIKQYKGAVSQA